jgi:hypothetical protein
MRNSRLKPVLIIAALFVAVSISWAQEAASKKKYPHPHAVHLNIPEQKAGGLKKITCATCHEAVAERVKEAEKAGVDEKSVMACFSSAIAGDKTFEECKQMADLLKSTRIEPYGPLKNYIQRKDAQDERPFFTAIHPANPYTFKPLLKRLVCVECHGQDRKVIAVMGRDGKVKEIPIFYGLGSKKRIE